jgi:hypothetical protein
MMTRSTTRYRRREGLVDEEGQRLVVEGQGLVVEEDRVVHIELASSPCLVVLFVTKLAVVLMLELLVVLVSKLGCCLHVELVFILSLWMIM